MIYWNNFTPHVNFFLWLYFALAFFLFLYALQWLLCCWVRFFPLFLVLLRGSIWQKPKSQPIHIRFLLQKLGKAKVRCNLHARATI